MDKINLKLLKEGGVVPRVHGNGFIQIDITDKKRLHIWGHPDIPRQKVYTPIHDHVFGFKSHIIKGRLINICYDFDPIRGGPFEIYVAKDKENTKLVPMCKFGVPLISNVTHVISGSGAQDYTMLPFVFHETMVTEPTVTFIMKNAPTLTQGNKKQPRVLVPKNVSPDNSFDRHKWDKKVLWDIVKEVLHKNPYVVI